MTKVLIKNPDLIPDGNWSEDGGATFLSRVGGVGDMPPAEVLYEAQTRTEESPYNLVGNEVDLSSLAEGIDNWAFYSNHNKEDFWWERDRFDDIITLHTWAALSDANKFKIINHGAYKAGDTDKIIFLMSPGGGGMSQAQAQAYLLGVWKTNQPVFVEAVNYRLESEMFYQEIGTYLTGPDAEDLFETIINLVERFKTVGHVGSLIPGSSDGIYDYWYNLNSYVATGLFAKFGAGGYVLNTGTKEAFQAAVGAVIFKGEY